MVKKYTIEDLKNNKIAVENYEKEDFVIITLDQLEGVKPTAEEDNSLCGILIEEQYNQDLTVELSDDYPKITIKYKGEEKVITIDDFKK